MEDSFQITAKITITMTKSGAVNVNGPLHDRLLCYGLIEIAKEIISSQNSKVPSGLNGDKKAVIIPPPGKLGS